MKKILQWIATDGMLHFFVSALISLSVLFIADKLWLSLVAGLIPAIAKEVWDVYIQKDNNYQQAWHDLVCDFAGLIYTAMIYLVA